MFIPTFNMIVSSFNSLGPCIPSNDRIEDVGHENEQRERDSTDRGVTLHRAPLINGTPLSGSQHLCWHPRLFWKFIGPQHTVLGPSSDPDTCLRVLCRVKRSRRSAHPAFACLILLT